MSPKTLKEYGLEFINEMAKDRDVAQQEIGVGISGAKSALLTQGAQHFSYKDMEEFVKHVRQETAHVVDSELTRITIKSLGRIREIIRSDEKFLESVTSPVDEEKVSELEVELKTLKDLLKEKNVEINQMEKDRDQNREKLDKIQDELNSRQMEIKRLQLQVENLHEKEELNQKQLSELRSELSAKEALIKTLKEEEKIHEKDINEALASVAETYKIQENYYQQMLEETIQQKLKEFKQEADLKMEELQKKLETERSRSEKSEKQHVITVARFEEALASAEKEQEKLLEKLSQIYDERTERNLLLDYTSRLLSTHPLYASILILLNLGGTLDLPTMARSVGAHPIKLKQMLEELVTKGLITISSDDPPMVNAVMV
jgi:DNA repair exonuclease SbcCD ATPase subunit